MPSSCAAVVSALESLSQCSPVFSTVSWHAEEELRVNATVNLKIQLCDFGSCSSTISLAPVDQGSPDDQPTARPPYTFPKPVAAWEPDTITSSGSL
jgi:hypothetical protein